MTQAFYHETEDSPWTFDEHYDAGAYLFSVPSVCTSFWEPEDWKKHCRGGPCTCYSVFRPGPYGSGIHPTDDFRALTREEAENHITHLRATEPDVAFEVLTIRVRPKDAPRRS